MPKEISYNVGLTWVLSSKPSTFKLSLVCGHHVPFVFIIFVINKSGAVDGAKVAGLERVLSNSRLKVSKIHVDLFACSFTCVHESIVIKWILICLKKKTTTASLPTISTRLILGTNLNRLTKKSKNCNQIYI